MQPIAPEDNSRILVISDMHVPYQHPQTWEFMLSLRRKYEPTYIISVGDECDKQALSYHDSDPDLPSAGNELDNAITELGILAEIFPEIEFVDSNHGSMVYRKSKTHGIPRKYIRDYGEVLDAPPGWRWHNNLLVNLPGGQHLYVTHGAVKNGLKLAQRMGCCVVQGHYHTEFNIQYTSSPSQLYWSMQVGCLIDDHSLAFHYNKTTAERPIIGCGIVIDGRPKLLPMILDEEGRWLGEVP